MLASLAEFVLSMLNNGSEEEKTTFNLYVFSCLLHQVFPLDEILEAIGFVLPPSRYDTDNLTNDCCN